METGDTPLGRELLEQWASTTALAVAIAKAVGLTQDRMHEAIDIAWPEDDEENEEDDEGPIHSWITALCINSLS